MFYLKYPFFFPFPPVGLRVTAHPVTNCLAAGLSVDLWIVLHRSVCKVSLCLEAELFEREAMEKEEEQQEWVEILQKQRKCYRSLWVHTLIWFSSSSALILLTYQFCHFTLYCMLLWYKWIQSEERFLSCQKNWDSKSQHCDTYRWNWKAFLVSPFIKVGELKIVNQAAGDESLGTVWDKHDSIIQE